MSVLCFEQKTKTKKEKKIHFFHLKNVNYDEKCHNHMEWLIL